jgi:D-sedoheptulose 7-phosphate isomerase
MRKVAEGFFRRLQALVDSVEVTDRSGAALTPSEGIAAAGRLIRAQVAAGGRLFFIGNGANAGIGSHMAADFSKNAGIPALTFTDPALLTAIGNDLGFDRVFAVPLERFAAAGDILMALSSSGGSPNVLRGVEAARAKSCRVVTLSGFAPDNPLRALGDINFYVPQHGYPLVEVVHHALCHCLLESLVNGKPD